jgi:hypothetical protein
METRFDAPERGYGKPCVSSRRMEQITGSESCMGFGDKVCEVKL